MRDLSNQAQKLLGRFSKTVDVMKSAYSKNDKMMSVWADDLYAVEAVMSFLETIRDAPAQGEPAWCQPMDCGKPSPRKFMLYYDDPQMGTVVFEDEAEARAAFERANLTWNCYLFGSLPLEPSVLSGQKTDVMAAAERAAKTVASWSESKREYANRAIGQSPGGTIPDLREECANLEYMKNALEERVSLLESHVERAEAEAKHWAGLVSRADHALFPFPSTESR